MLPKLTRRLFGWPPQGDTPPAVRSIEGAAVLPGPDRAALESAARLLGSGHPAEALTRLDALLAQHPRCAEAEYHAGRALAGLGRHEEALRRFERAVDLQADCVAAIHHQGMTLLELCRYEDAADCFKLALAHDPALTDARVGLGLACWHDGLPAEGVAHLRRASDRDPQQPAPHVTLAGLLHAANRLEEADAAYRRAVQLQPGVAALHHNWGLVLLRLGRADEGAACFERALALDPDFAEACFNLGNARRLQERGDDAVACYEKALALRPRYAEALVNLASALKERKEIARAFECYRAAQASDPQCVEAWHNMGVLLNQLDRTREAIECYEQAQRVRPGHRDSLLNLAIARLQSGDLVRGWRDYECRFSQTNPELGTTPRSFPYPVWQGGSLGGKRLLVWGEQGIGDEILFSALYEEVSAATGACTIECAPKLVPLFARSFPSAHVVARTEPAHPDTAGSYDFQSPAGGLARWLRADAASFPAHRPGHLVAAPDRVSYWRTRLAALGPGLKAGFSWRSNNLKGERALACARIGQWQPVLAVAGVHFVCLQYDECSAELERARAAGAVLHVFPEVDLFNDLDEAAALTRALDLVISAPTAVSLLAAALGVPTWQMSYGADWQVHGTDRNPWFPMMTQFRRRWDEDWDPILANIAERLRELAASRPGGTGAAQGREPAADPDAGLADATALRQQGRLFEARAAFERHLGGNPDSAAGWLGLARVLRDLDRLQESAEASERALRCDPQLAAAAVELGIVRYEQGRLDEAAAIFERVLAGTPGHLPARVNHALALYHRGDIEAAVGDLEQVLARDPAHSDARFNLAIALLARGELRRGWAEYESRFDQATLEDRQRTFPFPAWQGESLAGRTVLVWKEQSVGAQILFASMLPELVAAAGFCVIECTPKLVALFARSFPGADVVPRTDPPHPYTQQAIDCQVPLAGLARWLRPSLAHFPARSAWLEADPVRVEYWRARLDEFGAGPKVGFSWRSVDMRAGRALACTAIDQWRPVLGVPGAGFVCLQYDECDDEIAQVEREAGVRIHRIRDIDMFADLDEVAALMRALDLVISAPTAVSILSAALGVPTWQLHHGTDWQMHGAPSHPWLPSLRRIQRGVYQPWEEVLSAVGSDLRAWLEARGVRHA